MILWRFLAAVSFAVVYGDLNDNFDDFILRYGRPYIRGSPEYAYRMSVFNESLFRHRQRNSLAVNTWDAKFGVNKFSDMTQQEFAEQFLTNAIQDKDKYVYHSMTFNDSTLLYGTATCGMSLDWRKQNIVAAVRNQEKCGSCWAFSVVETVESAYSKKSGTNPQPLSPQQLISCEPKPADGCKGGDISLAMSWLVKTKTVVVAENVYPFNGGSGDTKPCITDIPQVGLRLLDFGKKNFQETEKSILEIICDYGPVSVAVDAISWQDYVGGIIQHHCPGGSLDHAVQIVGFDLSGPVPYYIVRNTWGKDWGLDGYVHIKYGDNMCGIAKEVVWVRDVEYVNEAENRGSSKHV
ncbi:cathepsin O-like [Corticium candelabrum]|uniref:cathepsin O-like n=1 Tax=Corticium candelabrum TaxID=121492 RepID=UPI002E266BED|nr:cathepsin O-like [Corticium candelabrum]